MEWGVGRGSVFRKGPVRSDNIPEEMSILFPSIFVVDGAQPREAGSCFCPLPRARQHALTWVQTFLMLWPLGALCPCLNAPAPSFSSLHSRAAAWEPGKTLERPSSAGCRASLFILWASGLNQSGFAPWGTFGDIWRRFRLSLNGSQRCC